ncbi:MAG: hypothetical protein WBO36_10255, partial [Saprospiraceae bacterium]
LNGSEPFEYHDEMEFKMRHNKDFFDQYHTDGTANQSIKNIEIYEKKLSFPVLLQFYKPLSSSWSLLASGGTVLSWKNFHSVAFSNDLNGTDVKQELSQSFDSKLNPSLQLGVGIERSFNRFFGQFMTVYNGDRSSQLQTNHHGDTKLSFQFRLGYQIQ